MEQNLGIKRQFLVECIYLYEKCTTLIEFLVISLTEDNLITGLPLSTEKPSPELFEVVSLKRSSVFP